MNRIKELRNEKNIKQATLGKYLGLEVSAISKLETGRVPLRDEYIIKLAEFFHCTTDYLLGISNVKNLEEVYFYSDKLYLNLSLKDYKNISPKQYEQIEDYTKYVLKDNLKKKKNRRRLWRKKWK